MAILLISTTAAPTSHLVIFLYIYAAVSPLCLHHAQPAKAAAHPRNQGTMSANSSFRVKVATMELLLVAMMFDTFPRFCAATQTSRRVWDPGIERRSCTINSEIERIGSTESPLITMVLPSTTAPTAPSAHRRVLPIRSLFQYSHPILSRPTVPNIQQCPDISIHMCDSMMPMVPSVTCR